MYEDSSYYSSNVNDKTGSSDQEVSATFILIYNSLKTYFFLSTTTIEISKKQILMKLINIKFKIFINMLCIGSQNNLGCHHIIYFYNYIFIISIYVNTYVRNRLYE